MGYLLVAIFSALYGYTLAPTVLWGDSAKLSIYVKEMYIAVDPIGNHTLHTLLGKFFSFLPVGDFAYRQNLMSAFFGLLALLFFYALMRELLEEKIVAFLASVALGFSHTFWLVSVVNESYALCMFFLSVGFWCLVKWERKGRDRYLNLHFFLIGVGLLNNMLEGVMIPATLLFLVCSEKGRKWIFGLRGLLGLSCLLLALFPILFLTFVIGPVPVGAFRWFVRPHEIFPEVFFYPAYLFYQFPLVGVGLAVLGVKPLFRERKNLFWTLAAVVLLDIFFASGYMRQRRFFLFLPSYFCFAILIGFGVRGFVNKKNVKRTVVATGFCFLLSALPASVYALIPHLANRYQIDLVRGRQLAFRNNNLFYLNPVKRGEFGAKEYGLRSFEIARPGSLIIGDFTPVMVLEYYQKIEGMRPDVHVIPSIDTYVRSPERRKELYQLISAELQKRPVYIADNDESYYDIQELEQHFNLVSQPPLWEIRNHGG